MTPIRTAIALSAASGLRTNAFASAGEERLSSVTRRAGCSR